MRRRRRRWTPPARSISTDVAERRNLILVNPAAENTRAAARTMMAAYQMVMPGERTRAHRHTPSALRLILDAEPGAYTIVNGEKVPMLAGDVVLTPNWSWHSHVNEGRQRAYWLDFLDVPLVHLLNLQSREDRPDDSEQKPVLSPGSSMRFAWCDTERRLLEQASASGVGPGDVEIELGNPALETMALFMRRLSPGASITCDKTHFSQSLCCRARPRDHRRLTERRSNGGAATSLSFLPITRAHIARSTKQSCFA